MGKMRVYELAKELGFSSKLFLKKLSEDCSLSYKSHMSTMSDEEVAQARTFYAQEEPIAAAEKPERKESVASQKSPRKKRLEKGSKLPAKNREASSDLPKRHGKKKRLDEEDPDDLEQRERHNRKKNVEGKKKEQTEESVEQRPVKSRKKNKKEKKAVNEQPKDDFEDIIEIPAEITVADFANAIRKNSMAVIGELIRLGIMAGLNETIRFETAEKVAEKFGVLIMQPSGERDEDIFADLDFPDRDKDLRERPPVITVMGHVDHGKTSILDAIRSTEVTRGEAGGITQHIGASTINFEGKKITFLDTPGHEAFTQMRMRGAQATDITILVVAADDGVMPQTVEAINHAKAAGTPIVVAINKMDKYEADPNRVMQELTEYGLLAEEWGGDTIMVPVSAKTGSGIEELLQMVLMVAEMEELKANPNRRAVGIVIEAELEKGRGATASVLVQKGTLRDDDYVVSGSVSGHIRAMFDAQGKRVKKAGPSMPVKILGLSDVPEAGDHIYAVANEKIARAYAQKAMEKAREEKLNKTHISLEELHSRISEGELKELNVIVKTDVKGTIDAVEGSLSKLGNDEVIVNIIHGAVGGITESDVLLAAASDAIIIGFNVRPSQGAQLQAEKDAIDIRTYRVIYEAVEDIQKAIQGMLSPKFREEVLGRAEVRQTFKVPNAGMVAGVYVTSGKLARNASVRLLRNDIVIHEGTIASLRRFKDDVKELANGYEGGVGIENYNDIKVGDQIECYHEVEVAQ
uniref:translation initiation factor IF-2 n=1 Tax=Ndongobacter massiliensis TaxID=1871025 RepID=UPI00093127D0|nr:translation initiation factor IF-2 [Ndongobacter massiliensis]